MGFVQYQEHTAPGAAGFEFGEPAGRGFDDAAGADDDAEYRAWRAANVAPQRQDGYHLVHIKTVRGDLTPAQFHGLADIVRRDTGGQARTTQEQNLVLRWVPAARLPAVWRALGALDLAEAGPNHITNVVSCPGTDSCKLGITASMGLARALRAEMADWNGLADDPGVGDIRIKMSGCPNGCGLHHIANIGFHGAAIKAGERQAPAYHVFVAGNRRTGRELRLGTLLKVRLPAKRVPDAVERFVRLYEGERNDGEEFNDFFDRVGAAPFEDAVRDLTLPPEFSVQAMDEFIDWDREALYVLERGEGECAV